MKKSGYIVYQAEIKKIEKLGCAQELHLPAGNVLQYFYKFITHILFNCESGL
jgi:hypothetical protein